MESIARHRVDFATLRAALKKLLADHRPDLPPIAALRRRASVYSSSYTIENLLVTLEDGTRLEMVLKDLSPESVLKTAREIRPGFLYRPQREIDTYRKVLQPRGLGAPVYYGAVQDLERERFWLFLERVKGPLLWQLEGGEAWCAAARWLAGLHAAFPGGHPLEQQPDLHHLLKFDEAFLRTWPSRAEEFVWQRNLADTRENRLRFAKLIQGYDRVVERMLRLPVSFIHGEFYASNVIVQGAAGHWRICPVDWEMAMVGPVFLDVATLTSGDWTEADRLAMIEAYREAMTARGALDMSLSQTVEAVDFCQLHLSVQMLGWSSDWHPPERHAQNWFREALRLADKLSIGAP